MFKVSPPSNLSDVKISSELVKDQVQVQVWTGRVEVGGEIYICSWHLDMLSSDKNEMLAITRYFSWKRRVQKYFNGKNKIFYTIRGTYHIHSLFFW